MPVITPDERLRRRIESKVRRFMAEESLWQGEDGLLAAVSGGPDSTALLLMLSRLAQREGVRLVAAYFDHALRGDAASKAEHEAVEALTVRLDAPLVTGSGDVRAEARRRKTSIEATARRLRYEFLADAARQSGCHAVATGHTLDDQAETLLLHVLRGTGLRGLGGIAPRSSWPFAHNDDLTLVRPLLALRRDETVAYCSAAGIEPVHDESNDSMAYQRNQVRQELMPALRRFNPRVEEALVRLAEAAREARSHWPPQVVADGNNVALHRNRLGNESVAYRHDVFAESLQALLEDRDGFGARHYRALERLLSQGHTGDCLDLPRGVTAELTRDDLVLRVGEVAIEALPECGVALPVPGEVRYGPLVVSAGLPTVLRDAVASAQLDRASVGERLIVRRRRDGDRMQPAGMTGTKKLQDIFVDAPVRRRERDSIPVFENERGIVWVGGLRIADWAQPHDDRPTVTLAYRRV